MPNTFFIFTAGVMLIKGEHSRGSLKWQMLVSPMMLAAYIASIIVIFGIHMPQAISQPVTMVGNITVPGSLLVIGSSLAGISMRKMLTHGKVYTTTVLRLFVVPLCLYLLFKVCGINELVNDINTTVIAMPVAAFGTMFCMKYERDPRLMTEITFMTTVLSICSIPICGDCYKNDVSIKPDIALGCFVSESSSLLSIAPRWDSKLRKMTWMVMDKLHRW